MFEKVTARLNEVAAATTDIASRSMSSLSDTVTNLKALGLSVRHVRMSMGLPPEIGATLTGSIEALNQDKIDKMIDGHQQDKALVAILETLRTASVFKEQLGDLGLKGVEADVTLGLSPKVDVRLMRAPGGADV